MREGVYEKYYEFFLTLDKESKISFVYSILKNTQESIYSSLDSYLGLEDGIDDIEIEIIHSEDYDEDDYIEDEYYDEDDYEEEDYDKNGVTFENSFEFISYMENILPALKKNPDFNKRVISFYDYDSCKMYICADSEEEIDSFIEEFIYSSGTIYTTHSGANLLFNSPYKYNRILKILGSVYQNICDN